MGRTSAAGQLAAWVGRKGKGTAHLRWGEQKLTLHLLGLQIIGVEGDDRERLAAAFGLTSGREWFAEAIGAVGSGQVSQAEANAVLKRTLTEQLREFFLAPDSTVRLETEVGLESRGLTISYPHLVVEMMLGQGGEALLPVFLPDPGLSLRRLPDFPRRVGALGLTDEALAVLAKLNDQRTALEIAEPSPHGREQALLLLAAALGAGLIEVVSKVADVALATNPPQFAVPTRRRGPWPAFLVILLLGALAAAAWYFKPWEKSADVVGGGGPWAIAVDGGCQPAELERLYRRQEQDRGNLRVVPFGRGDEQCYRLVWGHFPSKESAEDMVTRLPSGTIARGFPPHVVRVESAVP
jgi:hypothetical protein